MALLNIESTGTVDDSPMTILSPEDNATFQKAVEAEIKDATPLNEKAANKNDDSSDLARVVRGKYDDVKAQRNELEQSWLEDIRQYRGVYSPDTLAKMHPKRSKAFIRLTRTKVKTVDSRLSDFLFPATGDTNWDISPTPIAQYDQERVQQLLTGFMQQTGQEPTPAQLQLMIDSSAKEDAKKMTVKIEDQLADLRYRETMKEVIHNGDMYGTGILKGPMVNIKQAASYTRDDDGAWSLQEFDNITPFIETVSIWDIFPDLSATKVEDCNFIIQRHKMSKHKLLQLAERGDFDNAAISTYVKEHKSGDFKDEYYDLELQSLGGLTDASSSEQKDSRKYEVLEFWGYLDASDLEEAGVNVPEDKSGSVQVAACIWVIGDRVIKAGLAPIDGVKWPYFFYYYDKDETSIFGEGIPSIMRDVQELINASFRGMLDNAAISAGPQIEVNMDLMPEDEDVYDIYPFKVWPRTGAGADASNPAIRVMDVPSHTPEFLAMNEAFEKYGDEVTTIPRYMWGDNPGSGAGRTASGLSMMMGSANITIKDQVKNFDDGITKPFITAMYHWNMQFGDDEEVKGDYSVQARGSSSLIAKEVYANSLMQFANLTANPGFAPLVKQDNLLRSIVEVLDLNDKGLIKTEQEVAAERQQQTQQQQELQQFMSGIVETAREHGVSPKDMLDQGQALLNQIQAGKQNVQQAVTR
jgi:hypothetical protein